MQLMKPTANGKAYTLNVSLDDIPWAREMPILNGVAFSGWSYNGGTCTDNAIAAGVIRLTTFITCEKERFILVTPTTDATDDDIAKVINSVNKYAEALHDPRSCLVDPATGRYPKPVLSECDSDWV